MIVLTVRAAVDQKGSRPRREREVTQSFALEELWASVRAQVRSPAERESSVIEPGASAWICGLAALNATVTRCS